MSGVDVVWLATVLQKDGSTTKMKKKTFYLDSRVPDM